MANPTLTINDPETRKKVTERLIAAQKASKTPEKERTAEQKKDIDLLSRVKDQFQQPDTRGGKVRRESSQRGTPPEAAYITDGDSEIVDDPVTIDLDDEDDKKDDSKDNLKLNEPEEDEDDDQDEPEKTVKTPAKIEEKDEKREPNPDRRRIKDAEKKFSESSRESARMERETLKQMQAQQAEVFNKLLNSQQIFQKQQESARDLETADKVIGELIHAKNLARQRSDVNQLEDIVNRLMQAQSIKRNILEQQKQLNESVTKLMQEQQTKTVQETSQKEVKTMVDKIKQWAEDKPFNVEEVNGDYLPQDRNSKKAIAEIGTLVKEGWSVNDPDFFEELDERLAQKLPSWYEADPEPVQRAKPKEQTRSTRTTVTGGGDSGGNAERSLPGKININDIRDRGIRQMIRNIRDKQGEAAAAAFIKQHLLKGGN